MPKRKIEEEKNELVEEFFRQNDPKNIKSMDDMYTAWKNFFGPAFQKMLDAEMEAKLGYSKNERTDVENYRNGYYPERTVSTEMGDIPVKVPRDRNGEIESDLVPKYSRAVNGFDEKIIAMYALGLSDKDIQEQVKDIFGCNISPDMISDITDKIIPDIQEWQKRKLEKVYPIIFIDATHFHVKDNGQIVKKAAYVVLGIDEDGMKNVLTITVGENESAKYWMSVLNELKNRGVQDILILCADGLTGLKEAISAIYPKTEYQRCIVHQIRNSLKYVPYTDRKELAHDLKSVYQASNSETGYENLLELEEKWKNKYPGAIQSWLDNWDVLSVFFKFSAEIRKVMYTTNAIESLNSTYKRLNRNRKVFPTDMSLLKALYLSTMKAEKKWSVRTPNWDICLSQFRIMYEGRI